MQSEGLMIYIFRVGATNIYKIGFTADVSPEKRRRALELDQPLTVVAWIEGSEEEESKLHLQYAAWRVRGVSKQELFTLTTQQLEDIIQHGTAKSIDSRP